MFFFRELSVGRGSTATFGGGAMPKIQSVDAWDGKDGQVSRELYLQGWADTCSNIHIKYALYNIC